MASAERCDRMMGLWIGPDVSVVESQDRLTIRDGSASTTLHCARGSGGMVLVDHESDQVIDLQPTLSDIEGWSGLVQWYERHGFVVQEPDQECIRTAARKSFGGNRDKYSRKMHRRSTSALDLGTYPVERCLGFEAIFVACGRNGNGQ